MASDGQWAVDGAQKLAADFLQGAEMLDELVPVVVEKSAADLVALTQRNASGRPGPNAPTGDYRGSWRSERVRSRPDSTSRAVGTDRAQANRLEYGFVGTDSIGRTYNQPPYAHHGPARDVIEPNFAAAMEKVTERATRW